MALAMACPCALPKQQRAENQQVQRPLEQLDPIFVVTGRHSW